MMDYRGGIVRLLKTAGETLVFGSGITFILACLVALAGMATWGLTGGYVGAVFGAAFAIRMCVSRERIAGTVAGASCVAASALLGLTLCHEWGGLIAAAFGGLVFGLLRFFLGGTETTAHDGQFNRVLGWVLIGIVSSLAGWTWVSLFQSMEL